MERTVYPMTYDKWYGIDYRGVDDGSIFDYPPDEVFDIVDGKVGDPDVTCYARFTDPDGDTRYGEIPGFDREYLDSQADFGKGEPLVRVYEFVNRHDTLSTIRIGVVPGSLKVRAVFDADESDTWTSAYAETEETLPEGVDIDDPVAVLNGIFDKMAFLDIPRCRKFGWEFVQA